MKNLNNNQDLPDMMNSINEQPETDEKAFESIALYLVSYLIVVCKKEKTEMVFFS
jgi:hypothetical protein